MGGVPSQSLQLLSVDEARPAVPAGSASPRHDRVAVLAHVDELFWLSVTNFFAWSSAAVYGLNHTLPTHTLSSPLPTPVS